MTDGQMTPTRGQDTGSSFRWVRALALGALLTAIAIYRPLDPQVIPAWYRGGGDPGFIVLCMLAAALGRGAGFRDIWSRGFVSAFLLYSPAMLQGGTPPQAAPWLPTLLVGLLLAWPLLWLCEALWWRRGTRGA
ncbi:hypothetical protein [Achromobacter sp. 2789STDY5608621]|uniref:hypothetical protein n=1 Tax=Achromobacter sp. 2789STDY5608621 TaxID=1806496 RepID=UPI0012E242FD|nr:hypothetical protein [Achromobacter sp. 2789STDY5608621]